MAAAKYIAILFFCTVILAVGSCSGQTIPTEKLYIKDFNFNSIFGYKNGDLNASYCLLGRGYFRTIHSTDADTIINSWLTAHPKAIVVKVSSLATPQKSNSSLNITYCWIIDNNDTLNNYLIKEGSYPGGTMQRPLTWIEMSKEEKALYKNGDKPKVKILVDQKVYENFLQQIMSAEKYAKENKLGIWSNADH